MRGVERHDREKNIVTPKIMTLCESESESQREREQADRQTETAERWLEMIKTAQWKRRCRRAEKPG